MTRKLTFDTPPTLINYEAFRVLKMDIPDVSGKPDIETPAM